MTTEDTRGAPPEFLNSAMEAVIRIALIALLSVWCFQILKPFILPAAWGVIIAAAIHPTFEWLQRNLGNRPKLVATLLASTGVLFIVAPAILSAASLAESAQWLTAGLLDGSFEIPPAPEQIASWPIVGKPVFDFWQLANQSLGQALAKIGPELAPLASGFLGAAAGLGMSLLQFIVSIVLAGVLLVNSKGGGETAHRIASRLVHDRGEEFVELAAATIRGVTVGILGVAIIQAVLISIGLFAIGIPHASLWAVICLLFAVVQLPPFLVVVPIMVYAFSAFSTTEASIFAVWSTLACLSDNVLKPILLARGLDLPMAVIFMGSIGGFMTSGFIGLFLGAVILALGYKLFLAWLGEDQVRPPEVAT